MLLALLIAVNAHALGPIPNGTYNGSENCSGMSPRSSSLIVTDTTMEWDGQVNSFKADSNGFFQMKSVSGQNGEGMGHFTKDGLHYEAHFDFAKPGEPAKWAPGEDTFTYKDGKIFLRASASAGPMGKIECAGVFGK